MAKYVDGYVLTVPKKKLKAYQKMASDAGKFWMKHGALQYFECAGDDLNAEWSTLKFPKMARAKPGETVIFAFVIYKSKKDRDAVNAKVRKEMDEQMDHKDMVVPFDMKRMAFGGFTTIVEY